MLRDWGQERRYHHTLQGFNYRMEGLQGAVLRVKLRHLANWTNLRRERATLYNRLLADSAVTPPAEMPYARHVYHIYAVRSAERDGLQQKLLHRGIHTGLHYPIPVHLQEAHADLGYRPGQFPQSEAAAREGLSLPMYPEMPLTDVERTATTIVEVAASATVRAS